MVETCAETLSNTAKYQAVVRDHASASARFDAAWSVLSAWWQSEPDLAHQRAHNMWWLLLAVTLAVVSVLRLLWYWRNRGMIASLRKHAETQAESVLGGALKVLTNTERARERKRQFRALLALVVLSGGLTLLCFVVVVLPWARAMWSDYHAAHVTDAAARDQRVVQSFAASGATMGKELLGSWKTRLSSTWSRVAQAGSTNWFDGVFGLVSRYISGWLQQVLKLIIGGLAVWYAPAGVRRLFDVLVHAFAHEDDVLVATNDPLQRPVPRHELAVAEKLVPALVAMHSAIAGEAPEVRQRALQLARDYGSLTSLHVVVRELAQDADSTAGATMEIAQGARSALAARSPGRHDRLLDGSPATVASPRIADAVRSPEVCERGQQGVSPPTM